MRAILLASATTTTLRCALATSDWSQRPLAAGGALYQDHELIAAHTNFHWWPKPVTRN